LHPQVWSSFQDAPWRKRRWAVQNLRCDHSGPVIKVGSVEVVVADERTLLAMKMRASRGRRDEADIEFLLGKCQITSVDDALALYEEYLPEDDLPPQAIHMLRHALGESPRPGGSRRPS